MTKADLDDLRRDVAGFRGRFVFVSEHACGDCDGIENSIIFEQDDNEDGCAGWHTIIEEVDIGCADDDGAGEALARLLNAPRLLIEEIDRLEGEVARLRAERKEPAC